MHQKQFDNRSLHTAKFGTGRNIQILVKTDEQPEVIQFPTTTRAQTTEIPTSRNKIFNSQNHRNTVMSYLKSRNGHRQSPINLIDEVPVVLFSPQSHGR